jgi:hypothetical protein
LPMSILLLPVTMLFPASMPRPMFWWPVVLL